MYYFSLIDNFESIITNGILSQSIIKREGIKRADFSNQSVQYKRECKNIEYNRSIYSLHDFVPLYRVPLTPTLYAIADQGLQDEIFFIEINSEILKVKEKIILFTDGNAASDNTSFFDNDKIALNYIGFNILKSKYWNDFPDGKRKRNAEILVHEKIEPNYFNRIAVNNENLFDYIIKELNSINWKGLEKHFQVEINDGFFF